MSVKEVQDVRGSQSLRPGALEANSQEYFRKDNPRVLKILSNFEVDHMNGSCRYGRVIEDTIFRVMSL